jgi:hypothetical protein
LVAEPDPHQNVTDPQHWFPAIFDILSFSTVSKGVQGVPYFDNTFNTYLYRTVAILEGTTA